MTNWEMIKQSVQLSQDVSRERLLRTFIAVSATFCLVYSMIFMGLGFFLSAMVQLMAGLILVICRLGIGTKWAYLCKLISVAVAYSITLIQIIFFFGGQFGFQYMLIGHVIVVLMLFKPRKKWHFIGMACYLLVSIGMISLGDLIPYGLLQTTLDTRLKLGFKYSSSIGNMLGTVLVVVNFARENESLKNETKVLLRTDLLTHVYNRRYFMHKGERLFLAHRQVSLMLIDVDYLKSINETYGYDVGDKVLKVLASKIACFEKEACMVSRIDGGVFAVILEACSGKVAVERAEAFRKTIEETAIAVDENRSVRVTVSIGIVDSQGAPHSFSAMLTRASEALSFAKDKGRNGVFSLIKVEE